MKIALLVTGELRDFASCAHTLPLIDDPNVDLYVSTWDESRSQNSVLNIDTASVVTEQMIRDIVKRDAVIAIEPLSCMTEPRYNSKMLHRWIVGYDLVKDSGKTYDYVLFIRPDLYFDNNRITLTQEFQVAWYRPEHFLQDCVFGGPPAIIDAIFEKVTISAWRNAEEGDWHKWWTSQIKELNITPASFGREYRFTFFRPNARGAENYQQVYKAYEDWRDACIIEFGSKFGFNGPRNSWGESIVDSALEKYVDGHFGSTRRTAILVCGMTRGQMPEAVKSWKSLAALKADWFLSTFDKSAESLSTVVYESTSMIEGAYDHVAILPLEENVEIKKGHANTQRHLLLMKHFASKLAEYDDVLVLRPDCFLSIPDIGRFILDMRQVDNFSFLYSDGFLQDFAYKVTGEFFRKFDVLETIVERTTLFNPHIAIPQAILQNGGTISQVNSYDCTLLRPNARGENDIKQIVIKGNQWDKFHTPKKGA